MRSDGPSYAGSPLGLSPASLATPSHTLLVRFSRPQPLQLGTRMSRLDHT